MMRSVNCVVVMRLKVSQKLADDGRRREAAPRLPRCCSSVAHNVLIFFRIVRNTWGPDWRRSEPAQFRKFTIFFKNLMPAEVGPRLEADAQHDIMERQIG
jgi:hypothetical protein